MGMTKDRFTLYVVNYEHPNFCASRSPQILPIQLRPSVEQPPGCTSRWKLKNVITASTTKYTKFPHFPCQPTCDDRGEADDTESETCTDGECPGDIHNYEGKELHQHCFDVVGTGTYNLQVEGRLICGILWLQGRPTAPIWDVLECDQASGIKYRNQDALFLASAFGYVPSVFIGMMEQMHL
ncbi:hypothetical protein P691DRAFT_790811 [Macrolepiota fuliginosa MF-IS2]|uniref:Uncharacterized protein n=1 Tax=Macrolepiota fuliginosa MF-IS2 TaxID=1400762 RepID=A0A9P6C5N4_9AGAR|nr:hypothetical protein P691DRAFT_790811 [Macrolepiota fuliginosa MF-IS2]